MGSPVDLSSGQFIAKIGGILLFINTPLRWIEKYDRIFARLGERR